MWITNLLFTWCVRPGKTRTLTIGDRNRTYVVHAPESYDAKAPLPVILALHGAMMNAPMMAWFSGLNRKANEAGFIVVYPNGTGTHSSLYWNGGNCCGSAVQERVDDVAFINAMLDDLMQDYSIDPRRIYATGMSNGAIMAYRLASELSNRIAAIAPVAGSVGTEICQPQRPVSVLHFHGTKDAFVPFLGGTGQKSVTGATQFHSVEHSIRLWVKLNGCDENPKIDMLSKSASETKVTRKTYEAGKDGTEVALVVIEGGGHTWPGRNPLVWFLGKWTKNISANDLMWEFFLKHPMNGAT